MAMSGALTFGSFNLDNVANGYAVLRADPPPINQEILRSPLYYEGSQASKYRWPELPITIEGVVSGATQIETRQRYDALVLALANGENNLKLGYDDARYWEATLLNIQPTRLATINPLVISYIAQFICLSPFAFNASEDSEVSSDALTLVSGSEYSKQIPVDVNGTIYVNPTITIGPFPVAGPYGTTAVWITNTSNDPDHYLRINHTFIDGDTIIINSQSKSVKLNGVETNYSGRFPTLDPRPTNTNILELHSLSSSTPTIPVTVTWRPRYI